MKLHSSFFSYLAISLFSMLVTFQEGYSQSNFIGKWEGTFMNNFITVVNFNTNDHIGYEGNIKMFSGEVVIQDDKIVNINRSEDRFTFDIPAKETSFKGNFNKEMTELTGDFIFPDGSIHPIQLIKSMDETNLFEEYRKLKEQHFNARELNEDLAFLYKNLKEYHPQLFTTTSRDSMEVLLEKLRRKIDVPLTIEEFFVLATQLTDAVHCSHTGIRLPKTYQDLAIRFGNYFPFRLFFSNGKAFYIDSDKADDLISPGQEIISINDKTIDQLIAQIFFFIPSEAFNTTTKYNVLNKRFNELYYFLNDSEEFTVKYKTRDTIKSIILSSSNFEDVMLHFRIKETKVDFTYMDKMAAGVLKVPTFAIQDMDYYFYQLDSIFNDLQSTKTQNLILDLRDNDGGHPIFAAQLFSYLTEKDFVYFKRNEEVKEFEPLYNTMHPNELNYDGNIYVLINGGCLSTAGHLISLLKYNTNAIFIGEEPGSTFRCNDFSIQVTMPNTGIELNVPRTTFETAVTGFNFNKSFPIDYDVNHSIDEIIERQDVILEMAKTIINE